MYFMDEQEDYKKKVELFQTMAELDTKEKEIKASQGFWKAYVLSVLIPPIGLYFFIKYLFFTNGEDTNIKAGIVSLLLTIVSLAASFLLLGGLLGQSGSSENIQKLKDISAPNNQKQLLDLYK